MADYFFATDPGFGRWSWLMLLLWFLLLAVGAYLYGMWQERNPVRARFFRRMGLGFSILGAVGVVLLALKAFGVPFASWRIWGYVAALATLLFAGWAGWFHQTRLPRLLAATARSGGAGRRVAGPPAQGARTYNSNGARPAETQSPPPRPVATTGRREARRDRKRKSR